jgi:chromosome segregation ATPase
LKGKTGAVVLLVLLAVAFLPAGCGSRAGERAEQARSSYMSARAVLLEIQEFPSRVESMLREGELEDDVDDMRSMVEETRALLSPAYSALRTVEQKIAALREEGGEEYKAYADALQELVDLNRALVDAYSCYVSASGNIVEGLPFADDPSSLPPQLEYLNKVSSEIEELQETIRRKEGEAESLYLSL